MQVLYSQVDNEAELLGRDTDYNLKLVIQKDYSGKTVSRCFIKIYKRASQSIIFHFTPKSIRSKHVVKQYKKTSFMWINNQDRLTMWMQPWETTLEALLARGQVITPAAGLHIINQLIDGFVELQRLQIFFDFDFSCVAVLDSRSLEVAINPPCSLLLYEPAEIAYKKILYNLTKSFRREQFDLRRIFCAFCQLLGFEGSRQIEINGYGYYMAEQLIQLLDENSYQFMMMLRQSNPAAFSYQIQLRTKKQVQSLTSLQESSKSNMENSDGRGVYGSQNEYPNQKITKEPANLYYHQPQHKHQQQVVQPSANTLDYQNGELLIHRNSSNILQNSRMSITPNPRNRDKLQKNPVDFGELGIKQQEDDPRARYDSVDIFIT